MFIKSDQGNPHETIDLAQVHSPAELEVEAALQLVVQDSELSKAWISSRYFAIRWVEADLLYQSPPSTRVWEGTNTPRANIQRFTVATHVNSINAVLCGGLFYENPPFKLRGRSGAKANAIRAIETIEDYELDVMQFPKEVKLGLFSTLLNGTGIWKWGWKEHYETKWEYKQVEEPLHLTDAAGREHEIPTEESDKFQKIPYEQLCAHPFLEHCDIRHVLVDPGCRTPDIRDAKYVIHEMAMTYKDLMRWKDESYIDENGDEQKRYTLPSEEEIKSWFEPPKESVTNVTTGESYQQNTNFIQHAAPLFVKTTEDPLNEPLEVLERWDNDKVITVINKKLVIRNEANPFGVIPFYSTVWWPIQDCFWGMGLGMILGGDQRLQQGFINAIADIGTLAANAPLLRVRGQNVNTQQIRARLGGIIDVDLPAGMHDVSGALKPLELPKMQPEMFSIIQASEARTEQSSGASEILTMGSMPAQGRTSMGRTATGASGMMNAVNNRLGGLVEDFNRQVYQPWLWQIHDLNCQFLPPEVYRRVLSDELGEELKVSLKDFLTTGIKSFDVLAGSHLAVKQQMAQSMPLLVQYFSNPALAEQIADINGEYIDFSELMHMMTDAGGWGNQYYSVLKPLTPEMKQRREAQANAKAQQQSALADQKFQQKSQLLDQETTGKAANEVIRRAIETAATPEAITGEAGGEGFGSATPA